MSVIWKGGKLALLCLLYFYKYVELGNQICTRKGHEVGSLSIWWRIYHQIWWWIWWITKFGDRYGDKFGDDFGESPNVVMNSSPYLVMNFVIHQVWWWIWWWFWHQIWWRIWWQIWWWSYVQFRWRILWITKFGNELGDKFGDVPGDEFGDSPNRVMNPSPNLVMTFVTYSKLGFLTSKYFPKKSLL